MASKTFWFVVLSLMAKQKFTLGVPLPQNLPGQIPPHLATHPALSSVVGSRESALMQYAYNSQNRRGPNPSPLVLQNNQERNLQLVNQLSSQRSGSTFVPGNGQVHGHGHNHQNGQSSGNANPEQRAIEYINQFKGGASGSQGQGSYNPVPLKQDQLRYPQQGAHGHDRGHHGHSHGQLPDGGDENEGEDIRRLKSLLNLPTNAGPQSNYYRPGGPQGSGSPNIGVAGQRGVINPGQYGQGQGHQHNHSPTPFPLAAQSQHSLGNLNNLGHSSRPPYYPGSGPSSTPGYNHNQIPYGSSGQNQHGHYDQRSHGHQNPYSHGQDARSLIQSHDNPNAAYQNLVYIDPIRDPNSINRHIEQNQSVFVLPASDYNQDDFQRLLNRPAEILIDVIPSDGQHNGGNIGLHNFSFLLTPSTYARCAQTAQKKGYGGKCKLILKVGQGGGLSRQPVQVSY